MQSLVRRAPVVLVVDDEATVFGEVAAVLQPRGFVCLQSDTPEQALAAIEEQTPELVICDASLHGYSGMRLREEINDRAGCRNVPMMLLSATQIPDIIRRSHAGRGTYSLRKPFAGDVLAELVDRAMATSSWTAVGQRLAVAIMA